MGANAMRDDERKDGTKSANFCVIFFTSKPSLSIEVIFFSFVSVSLLLQCEIGNFILLRYAVCIPLRTLLTLYHIILRSILSLYRRKIIEAQVSNLTQINMIFIYTLETPTISIVFTTHFVCVIWRPKNVCWMWRRAYDVVCVSAALISLLAYICQISIYAWPVHMYYTIWLFLLFVCVLRLIVEI